MALKNIWIVTRSILAIYWVRFESRPFRNKSLNLKELRLFCLIIVLIKIFRMRFSVLRNY